MEKASNLSRISYLEHGFLNAEESGLIRRQKSSLSLLKQIHSNKVVVAMAAEEEDSVVADGQITTQSGFSLAIKTADCVPVLLADKTGPVIGALHAGWRGAFQNIIAEAVNLMLKHGSRPENIAAAIGPAISGQSYKIGTDFYDLFRQKSLENEKFFRNNNHFFDLPAFVAAELAKSGINDVETITIDTFTDDTFFSFRRNRKETGRNISLIKIK